MVRSIADVVAGQRRRVGNYQVEKQPLSIIENVDFIERVDILVNAADIIVTLAVVKAVDNLFPKPAKPEPNRII